MLSSPAEAKIELETSRLYRPVGFMYGEWDEFDEFDNNKPKEKPKPEKESEKPDEVRREKVSKMKAVLYRSWSRVLVNSTRRERES